MVSAICEAWARVSLVGITGARNRIFSARDEAPNSHIPTARDRIAQINRRIGRANAGFSRKVSVIRDSGNCVVVDAVTYEPVSTPKFPANREKNREFRQIRPLCEILKADTRANSKVSSEIP